MTNFYKIPVTERRINFGTYSLIRNLREISPLLYEREQERVRKTYEVQDDLIGDQDIKNYNMETANLYMEQGLPQYFIAIGSDYCCREISTGNRLRSSVMSLLNSRRVSKEEAMEYIERHEEYDVVVQNFFNCVKEKEVQKIK